MAGDNGQWQARGTQPACPVARVRELSDRWGQANLRSRSSRLTPFLYSRPRLSSRLSPEHNSGPKDNGPQQQRESKIPLRPKRSHRFGRLPNINSQTETAQSAAVYVALALFLVGLQFVHPGGARRYRSRSSACTSNTLFTNGWVARRVVFPLG